MIHRFIERRMRELNLAEYKQIGIPIIHYSSMHFFSYYIDSCEAGTSFRNEKYILTNAFSPFKQIQSRGQLCQRTDNELEYWIYEYVLEKCIRKQNTPRNIIK